MQEALGDYVFEILLFYLNDIIVYSSDFSGHIERLDKVFTLLQKYRLKLKPAKCHLLQREIRFLGHIISE